MSVVTGDTLVETIYRPDRNETAFVVVRDAADPVIVPEWRDGDQIFTPVHPDNNLLRHRALFLPSGPVEYGTTEALLTKIKKYVGSYVSLPAEAAALTAAYVLLTWVYDCFNELPYLRFRGDYGTGKTRALLVMGSICYKAFFASGASTISPIFHTLDSFNGTLIFDEADFRFTDEKAELVKILNNGNVKGFPVLRSQVTPSKEFNPRAFTIYGPKIVAMRRSYDDRALESRFLTIVMESGRAGGVPINLPEAQKAAAAELRDQLLMYRIRTRRTIALEASLASPVLEPRMNQILLPLLSVAPTEELREVILAAATQLHSEIVAERSGSSEGQIMSIVARLVAANSRPISVAEVTTAFTSEFSREYDRPINNRWIASLLRKLGIGLYKSNGIFVFVPRQNDRIAALCVRYGVGGGTIKNTQGDRDVGNMQAAEKGIEL